MFVTGEGYLGLGQEVSEVGDVACVFYRGETPFVLRG